MGRAAFVALVSMGAASAQDECATAVAVGASTPFDTTTATLSTEAWNCAGTGAPDLWFTYTAVGQYGLHFDLCGATYDTGLEIYTGACGALVLVECNDDYCSLQSGVDIANQVPGTLYTIRVGGWNNSVGVGTLVIEDNQSPPWDECSGAMVIGDGPTAVDTSVATTSAEAWGCGFNVSNDFWYAYTAVGTGPATIETCGSGFDTLLEIFSGDCGSLTLMECNDDACLASSGLNRSSILTPNLVKDETYYIRIGGYNGDFGVATLVVDGPDYPAQCVTTLFAANNGGNVGGAVYMDMTLTQDVSFSGLKSNYDAAVGDPIGIEMWVSPMTYTGGNHAIPGLWTMVGSDDGTSVGNAGSALTSFNFTAPVCLPAGSYGVALVAIGDGHRYTTGSAAGFQLQYPSADGVITLDLGGASSVPFTGGIFDPRVWNGEFCYETLASIGTSYCGPATVNSSGSPAYIGASGSNVVADNALILIASDLPADSFGYFLCSTVSGVAMPGGTSGVLCLGGFYIGRGVGGRILQANGNGVMCIGTDLSAMPHPSLGSVPVQVGDTWYYQAWFRDAVGGVVTSNFSDGVGVTFQ